MALCARGDYDNSWPTLRETRQLAKFHLIQVIQIAQYVGPD